jgi:replicative DNA helicase
MDHERAIQGIEQGSGQRLKRGVHISNVYTPDRMLKAYSEYIAKLKDNRFLTGLDKIDKIIRGVAGGEILTIIARPGAFKTATLQNMMGGYLKASSQAAVMFEIEMPISSMAERQMEIVSGFKGYEIEAIYAHHDEEQLRDRIEREFIAELDRLFVIPTAVGIEDIPRYVNLIEQNFKVKVGLMGVDYLQLVDEAGRDEYEKTTKIARGFKNIAKLLDIPGIMLSQTSRKGGDSETEITMDMGRGAGAIEEAADILLGMWWNKSSESMEGGELICKILKARKGKRNICFALDIDPETLQLKPTCYPWEPPPVKKRRGKGIEA